MFRLGPALEMMKVTLPHLRDLDDDDYVLEETRLLGIGTFNCDFFYKGVGSDLGSSAPLSFEHR